MQVNHPVSVFSKISMVSLDVGKAIITFERSHLIQLLKVLAELHFL